ncbi:hypothetical protein [Sphingomonas sp. SCN 67-18]|uniref:hypothetical protein n=1 Tax=uncultured Sphingomonas sp. TaxID=158754 RepID=UPI0025E20151|nr:hypothetical protein [Sphingomonas sp. SCN 67-18]
MPGRRKPDRTDKDAPDSDRAKDRKHVEKLLDEALKESFPASDPPSIPIPR